MKIFGEYSLMLALFFSLLQITLPAIGLVRRNVYLAASARTLLFCQFICIACAYFTLTAAFVSNDFSIIYVAANSHPSLPLIYRLTAVWGGHEGSILLWTLILDGWSIAYLSWQPKQTSPQQISLTLSILGLISFCFICFIIFTSNPFLSTTQPLTGNDLNPLLQDPGFIIHPPMLYIGYVGFSITFALTQAALLNDQINLLWAQMARRFAMIAWCFLTAGIALGSWWAYRVLGWGGFWFWDPVENASLLPWIAGTALIHVLVLAEKRNLAKGWAVFLTIVCFALSLLGTFLVRSGILISVHAFANDPARGLYLLCLFALIISAALFIYLKHLPKLRSAPTFHAISRETILLISSSLLFIAMLTILLGTLYPLILNALHLGVISVGPPYFNTVLTPLLFISMIFMACGPYCHWQTQSLSILTQHLGRKLLISLIIASCACFYFTEQFNYLTIIILTLSFLILLSCYVMACIIPSMSLAHAGFVVFILGVILSANFSQEKSLAMMPGSITQLGPYQFLFRNETPIQGANYRGINATFSITKNMTPIAELHPEKRIYSVREMVITKVAINPGLFRDLYIALGEPLDLKTWSVHIYYKPFIRWIWAGSIMMIMGGLIALKRKSTMRSA